MAQGNTQRPRTEQVTKQEKKHPEKQAAHEPSQTELDKERADGEGMAPAPKQPARQD